MLVTAPRNSSYLIYMEDTTANIKLKFDHFVSLTPLIINMSCLREFKEPKAHREKKGRSVNTRYVGK